MRISSVRIENFGPFQTLDELKIGDYSTFIGKNDVGKSHILRALDVFFGTKVQEQNVCCSAHHSNDVVIEVAFDNFPTEIMLEDGIVTSFIEERLVDEVGSLRIRKRYPRNNLGKCIISLLINDFDDDSCAGLPNKKEQDLNTICTSLGIPATRSGSGITNKSKRESVRQYAETQGIPTVIRELVLSTNDNVNKAINRIVPDYIFFKSDTPLEVGISSFQSWFKPFVKSASIDPQVESIRQEFEEKMRISLQEEVVKIHERLKKHTDAFSGLIAKPSFEWDKAVKFDIAGLDADGIETSLSDRGSGMQRLFMVSYFEYMAEEKSEGQRDIVYAIEEPENCLHPGLQRELVKSFRELVDEGFQILITSHSPVFAGASPLEDLTLITRTGGIAASSQIPSLVLSDIARELGVGPSDQLFGYDAVVFVEGPDDEIFYKTVATKLKNAGHLQQDFNDVNIGFIITGGDNLKHWVDRQALIKIHPRFSLVVDSDKSSANDPLPAKKLNWESECVTNGGIFFALRKRAIENYVHQAALTRRGISLDPYDEYTHMKHKFGRKIWETIHEMNATEILEMDEYEDNGVTHHELKEIIETLLSLPS